MYFEVDNHGLFKVTDVVSFQEYEVEEKIPVKTQMPSVKKTEDKKDEKKEEKTEEKKEDKKEEKTDEKKEEKTEDKKEEKTEEKKEEGKSEDMKDEKKPEESKEAVEMVDAPIQYETKIRVKCVETKLSFTSLQNPTFGDATALNLARENEKVMQEKEAAIQLKAHLKNDCESFSYEFKRRADEDLEKYFTPAERTDIKNYCDELISWL